MGWLWKVLPLAVASAALCLPVAVAGSVPPGVPPGPSGRVRSGSMAAAGPAQPGSLNDVEGQVTINGRKVTEANIGMAQVHPGSVLATRAGKAELLLTPGVVLRIADNSAVRVDSALLTDTRVSVLQGSAMIEADRIYPENHIQIADANSSTLLVKNGLYRFDTQPPAVSAIAGEAKLTSGNRTITVGKSHEVLLAASAKLRARHVDRPKYDELYAWSDMRSQYLANASAQVAENYSGGGPGWVGTGWYWDPAFDMYGFIPADGWFYGPFGYPFFSPYWAGYYWPAIGFGYGYYGYPGFRGGYYGHPGFRGGYYGHPGFHGGFAGHPAFRGGFAGGSAMRGFAGGGMRMGGGFGGGHMGGGFGGGGRR